MPKRITLHVFRIREGWVVHKEGNIREVSTHTTQREAIDAARKVARSKHGQLIVHRRDGRVGHRYRYNSDPLPPRSAPKALFHPSLDDEARKAIQAAVDMVVRKRRASQHVVPHGKGRAVRSEGKTKSSSVHNT